MLTIRLQRVGRKNDPSFRVVVTDSSRSPRGGKFIEVLGSYDARKGKGATQLDGERIKHWISMGAQVSDTVHNILVAKKLISSPKRAVKIPAKAALAPAAEPEPQAAEEAPAEAPVAEEVPTE